MYSYKVFGLGLYSEIQIPELRIREDGSHDIEIRLKEAYTCDYEDLETGSFLMKRNEGGGVDIVSKGVARYSISGTKVDVFPEMGVSHEMLRVPILGVVLATVMANMGWVVLHGSCVSVSHRAVAFIGNKYQGKSTLAASLVKRGHPLITDDVIAIKLEDGEPPKVFPGPFGIKLWPEAIESIGFADEDLYTIYEGSIKRMLKTAALHCDKSMELRDIYVLYYGDTYGVEEMSKQDGLLEIMRNEFYNRYPEASDDAAVLLMHRSGQLRKAITMRSLVRPVDKDGIETVAEMVEAHSG